MSQPVVTWILGLAAGVVAALTTRVQLLPDVIDLSIVPTGAGSGSLLAAIGVAYAKGAPVWSVYLAIVVAILVPLPAYIRWDNEHYG